MFIKRTAYDKMLNWKNHHSKDMALFVKGPIQVGKTTLIHHFGVTEYSYFLELNLMTGYYFYKTPTTEICGVDLDLVNYNEHILFYIRDKFSDFQDNTDSCLFIDEIQESITVFNSIRGLAKEKRFHLMVTGTYLDLALRDRKYFYPVGDIYTIILRTLSFTEFRNATTGIFKSDYDCFKEYLNIGGYPRLVTGYLSHEPLDDLKLTLLNSILGETTRYLEDSKFQLSYFELFQAVVPRVLNEKRGVERFGISLSKYLKSIQQNKFNKSDFTNLTNWLLGSGIIGLASVPITEDDPDIVLSLGTFFNDLLFVNYISTFSEEQNLIRNLGIETFAYKALRDINLLIPINLEFTVYETTKGELEFSSKFLPITDKKYVFEVKSGDDIPQTGKELLESKKIDKLYIFRSDIADIPNNQSAESNIVTLPLYMMEETIQELIQESEKVADARFEKLFGEIFRNS